MGGGRFCIHLRSWAVRLNHWLFSFHLFFWSDLLLNRLLLNLAIDNPHLFGLFLLPVWLCDCLLFLMSRCICDLFVFIYFFLILFLSFNVFLQKRLPVFLFLLILFLTLFPPLNLLWEFLILVWKESGPGDWILSIDLSLYWLLNDGNAGVIQLVLPADRPCQVKDVVIAVNWDFGDFLPEVEFDDCDLSPLHSNFLLING